MRVISQLNSFEGVTKKESLQKIFNSLQKEYDQAFEDLGVIDAQGSHVAYIGPFRPVR